MGLDSWMSQGFKYSADTTEVKLPAKLKSGAERFPKSGGNYQNIG